MHNIIIVTNDGGESQCHKADDSPREEVVLSPKKKPKKVSNWRKQHKGLRYLSPSDSLQSENESASTIDRLIHKYHRDLPIPLAIDEPVSVVDNETRHEKDQYGQGNDPYSRTIRSYLKKRLDKNRQDNQWITFESREGPAPTRTGADFATFASFKSINPSNACDESVTTREAEEDPTAREQSIEMTQSTYYLTEAEQEKTDTVKEVKLKFKNGLLVDKSSSSLDSVQSNEKWLLKDIFEDLKGERIQLMQPKQWHDSKTEDVMDDIQKEVIIRMQYDGDMISVSEHLVEQLKSGTCDWL